MSRYLIKSGTKSYQWPDDGKRSLLENPIPDIKDSDNWAISDWKEYVNYLNLSGIKLLKKLAVTEKKLIECEKKKSRAIKTNKYNRSKSLLSLLTPPKGRPKGSKNRVIAKKALFIKWEQEVLKKEKCTNETALAKYYLEINETRSELQALMKAKRNKAVINEMSKLNKIIKNN